MAVETIKTCFVTGDRREISMKEPGHTYKDLNVWVAIGNTRYEDIARRYGLGKFKENGERLANLCASNKVIISGSIFSHKPTHQEK